MSAQPIVSVIMPVHNARRFVSEAVQSILDQSLRDFELIIIDDGSTDGSDVILQSFARLDQRITLIRQHNAGVCAAANRGLALARGEFYARMDHDDIALPDRFQRQVEYLRANPACVAVGSQVLMVDEDGLPIRVPLVPTEHEEIEAAFARTWSIFHSTLMARTEVMRCIDGYDGRFDAIEDLDMFIKLGEHGRLANLPDVLVHYRQHISSICYSRASDQVRQRRELIHEVAKRRGRPLRAVATEPVKTVRHGPERSMRWAYEKMWAWWALTGGYVGTARRHAVRAVRLNPLRFESWLLLYCAMRGH